MRDPPHRALDRRVAELGEVSDAFVATVELGDMAIPGDCTMHVGDSMVQYGQYTQLVANARVTRLSACCLYPARVGVRRGDGGAVSVELAGAGNGVR